MRPPPPSNRQGVLIDPGLTWLKTIASWKLTYPTWVKGKASSKIIGRRYVSSLQGTTSNFAVPKLIILNHCHVNVQLFSQTQQVTQSSKKNPLSLQWRWKKISYTLKCPVQFVDLIPPILKLSTVRFYMRPKKSKPLLWGLPLKDPAAKIEDWVGANPCHGRWFSRSLVCRVYTNISGLGKQWKR